MSIFTQVRATLAVLRWPGVPISKKASLIQRLWDSDLELSSSIMEISSVQRTLLSQLLEQQSLSSSTLTVIRWTTTGPSPYPSAKVEGPLNLEVSSRLNLYIQSQVIRSSTPGEWTKRLCITIWPWVKTTRQRRSLERRGRVSGTSGASSPDTSGGRPGQESGSRVS